MTDDEFKMKVAQAKQTVASFDACDGYQDRNIGTILAALEAGIRQPESNSHFDAYVMLEDLNNQLHGR